MVQCVAFDMDDTLYDEVDYYQSGLAVVASAIAGDHQRDSKVVFSTLWDVFVTGNHKTTFNESLDKLGISYDSDDINRWVNILRSHSPKITLPSDSRDILEKLKNKYRLVLITDGFLPAQKLKVEALGIEHHFDLIIYTEELGREYWKPSPVPFEKLLAEMALLPDQCVYVGDNPVKDFIAPNQLGMKTVRITRKNHLHTFSIPEGLAAPQYEIKWLMELPKLLERLDV